MTAPVICCSRCGDDESGLVKRDGRWVCDECEAWSHECDSLDLEEWDQKRRERLAEAQEY